MTGADLLTGTDRRRWWPLERDPMPLESSEPGAFVAGDLRHGSVKRVASAVGEGRWQFSSCTATWLRAANRASRRD